MSKIQIHEVTDFIQTLQSVHKHTTDSHFGDHFKKIVVEYLENLNPLECDKEVLHLRTSYGIKNPIANHPALPKLDPEVLIWLRPDWTPELFLSATQNYDDKERQEAVLKTRDIPLISWYVNHRAGRPRNRRVDSKLLDSQVKIIKNEWDELLDSVNEKNGYTMRDDQADLFLVVGGLGAYYPANMNQDFVDMVRANFTRIDDNEEDAKLTQEKWTARGIPCAVTPNPVAGTFPVLVTEECECEGAKYSVGKFLKSHKFTDATYKEDDGFTAEIV